VYTEGRVREEARSAERKALKIPGNRNGREKGNSRQKGKGRKKGRTKTEGKDERW
jgi:hypothetical protein